MEKKYTFEEFKEAAAKEITKVFFLPEDARKAGIPLEKWCRAYVEYMAEHDEDNIVQEFYEPYLDGSHAFEYQVQILANTWLLDAVDAEQIPLEKLSKYL